MLTDISSISSNLLPQIALVAGLVSDVQVVEGDAGTTNATFRIELTRPSSKVVRVAVRTLDGTALASDRDYLPLESTTLVFQPGTTSLQVVVPVVGDLRMESDETFRLVLSDPVGAQIQKGEGVCTILDDDTTTLSFDPTTVVEGDSGTSTEARIPVHLSRAAKEPIHLRYRTRDGTANSGRDYVSATNEVVVPVGALSATLTATVLGDNEVEPDETFDLTFAAPTNARLASPSVSVTILDDDLSLLISEMRVSAEECVPGNSAIDPGEQVAVDVRMENRGVTSASDLVLTLLADPQLMPVGDPARHYGFLSSGGGLAVRSFSFRAFGDCGARVTARFQARDGARDLGILSRVFSLGVMRDGRPGCCTPGDLQVSASAVPNPVVVGQSVEFSVRVSNNGTAPAIGVVLTNRLAPLMSSISLRPSQGFATNAGGFTVCELGRLEPRAIATVTLTATAGSVATMTRLPDVWTSFFLVGSSESEQTPADNVASVTTQVIPPNGLTVGSVVLREGTGGVTNARVRVWLWPQRAAPVDVDWATFDETAVSGQDYVAASGSLHFGPGQTVQTNAVVSILGDAESEVDETLGIRLSNARGEARINGDGRVTILDDDDPRVRIGDASTLEGRLGDLTSLVFPVTLSRPLTTRLEIPYRTLNGSARDDSDFYPTNGVLRIEPGLTNGIVEVLVIGDDVPEADETMTIRLGPVAGAVPSRAEAVGTIQNDDLPPVLVSIDDAQVLEGSNGSLSQLLFRVHLSRDHDADVDVEYATTDGTATAPSDYLATRDRLHFPPGIVDSFAVVTVRGDTIAEPDETVLVCLSNPKNAELGRGCGTGTLLNDDYLPHPAPAGWSLTGEECDPPNRAVDPLERVQLSLSITNTGLAPTTNLTAVLTTETLGNVHVVSVSGPVSFGRIVPGALAVSRPFQVQVDGPCGGSFWLHLRLSDGGQPLGSLEYGPIPLGTTTPEGVPACCSQADVAVSVSAPASIEVGDTLAYELVVRNNGPSPARAVRLSDKLEGGTTLSSLRTTRGACVVTNDLIECELGVLAPGEAASISLVLTNAPIGNLRNLARVSAAQDDPDETNNSASALTRVLPPVGLSISGLGVTEGENAVVTVRLFPATARTVSVRFSTVDGSATAANGDYVPVASTVVFPPGVTATNVIVQVIDDVLDEPDEYFEVHLSEPVGATIAVADARVLVTDNDPPCLSINDVEVNVGLTNTARAYPRIQLSTPSSRLVTVRYVTADGTAVTGTDYEPVSGILSFEAGETEKEIPILISGNTLDESVEWFRVILSQPTNATLFDAEGVVTISDQAPGFLTVDDLSALEGDTGITRAYFTLRLSAPLRNTASVRFMLLPGTATPGIDYVPASGRLDIPAGQTVSRIPLDILGDRVWELDETVELILSEPQSVRLSRSQAVATLLNDDPQPTVTTRDASVREGDAGLVGLVFPLILSNPSSQEITVSVGTRDGTARSGADYLATDLLVRFLPGEVESSATVQVIGDRIDEPDETLFLTLRDVWNGQLGGAEVRGVILDDDEPPVLSVTSATVREGDSGITNAVFHFSLASPSGKPVRWHVATTNLTATGGVDYAVTNGWLTLAPGQTQADWQVPVFGDVLPEPDEEFLLLLDGEENLTLGRRDTRGIILNDDSLGNPPPVIRWVAPADGSVFPVGARLELEAQAFDPAGAIEKVEFFSVGSEGRPEYHLGTAVTEPYRLLFSERAEEGTYSFMARATDNQGATAWSDPSSIEVTGGDILIVGDKADAEIAAVWDHLVERAVFEIPNANQFKWEPPIVRLASRGAATPELMRTFRVVIWDDCGRNGGIEAHEVDALWEAWNRAVGLYLIGAHLPEAGLGLPETQRTRWSILAGPSSAASPLPPGMAVRSAPVDLHQELFRGYWGDVDDFECPEPVSPLAVGEVGQVRATLGGAPVLVRYPGFEDFENPFLGRRLVQAVLIGPSGGQPDQRQVLLRNGIIWLLGGGCGAFSVTLEAPGPAIAEKCLPFSTKARVDNNGECPAGAVVVIQEVAEGLEILGTRVSLESGGELPAVVHRLGNSIAFGLGVLPVSTVAFLETWLVARDGGTYTNRYSRRANYRPVQQAEALLEVPVSTCTCPHLEADQGLLYRVGECPVRTILQSSTDLVSWINLRTNAPSAGSPAPLLNLNLQSTPNFYRLLIVP